MSQSTPDPGAPCEGCNKPNAWMLIDPMYSHVCGDCVENGNGDVVFTNGVYCGFRACKCGKRYYTVEFADGKLTCPACKTELFLGGLPPSNP